jgi:hypothetical protein
MTMPPKNYWFPVKTYGWGWGCPNCWQGWVVILAYVVLLGGGALVIEHSRRFAQFLTFYSVALSVVLVAVCWWKGEPPRWQWGGNDKVGGKK